MMSRVPTLRPLDTEMAFVFSRSPHTDHDLKSPTSTTPSGFTKTPLSSYAQTLRSAFPKTPVSAIPDPHIVSRHTTHREMDAGEVDQTEAIAYDSDDDGGLTEIGNLLHKIHSTSILARYSLYILPVATLLAIPIIVTAIPPHDNARAGSIRLLALFIWVEIAWLGIWLSRLIAKLMPILFQAACGLVGTGVRKYSLVLKALEIPISVLLWTTLCYSTTDMIFVFDKDAYHDDSKGQWVRILKRVWHGGMVLAGIFVIEKSVIQLITLNYYRKQYARKIRESKHLISLLEMLYDTSSKMFPEFGTFEQEDNEIYAPSLVDLREKLDRRGINFGSKLFANAHRARYKAATAFNVRDIDAMGLQPRTHAYSIVTKALENERSSKALARRLWMSLCSSGKDAIYKQDIEEVLGPQREEEATEIFDILDQDGNGDVSLEEMTTLVVNCGLERRDRASSIQDISLAISVLDKILSIGVIIATTFLYTLFFSRAFDTKISQIWTSTASLAFSISGTVTEFFACCIFLFVKHPYDVGDRVNIEHQELIVKHISLMYSIFKRVDNNTVVQIPHNVANTLWIENVTRSKAMKERVDIKVYFSTKMEDILALRKEMEGFVNSPANRHDFLPDIDIELRSVEDLLALKIRIEVRHKSNWSNESLRQYRRNKFMGALFEAFNKLGIERPLGNSRPGNPIYTCELNNQETLECQRMEAERAERQKTWESLESLLPNKDMTPAQAMFPGLKKRSPGAENEGVGRRPSIWSPL